jgi:hypothetical protein
MDPPDARIGGSGIFGPVQGPKGLRMKSQPPITRARREIAAVVIENQRICVKEVI